jgi:hypothetical protein
MPHSEDFTEIGVNQLVTWKHDSENIATASVTGNWEIYPAISNDQFGGSYTGHVLYS